jgi:hypothetical protein
MAGWRPVGSPVPLVLHPPAQHPHVEPQLTSDRRERAAGIDHPVGSLNLELRRVRPARASRYNGHPSSKTLVLLARCPFPGGTSTHTHSAELGAGKADDYGNQGGFLHYAAPATNRIGVAGGGCILEWPHGFVTCSDSNIVRAAGLLGYLPTVGRETSGLCPNWDTVPRVGAERNSVRTRWRQERSR